MREQQDAMNGQGARALALEDEEPRGVAFVSPLGPLLEEFLGTALGAAGHEGAESPVATVLEDRESYRIVLVVPESRAEDLSIELLHDRVSVCGAKLDEGAGRTGRSDHAFVRSFRLPFDVDPDRARATLDDGVLTLVFAKRLQPGPRSIEIATASGASLGGDGNAR